MRHLYELQRIRDLANTNDELVNSRVLGEVEVDGNKFEIISLVIGPPDETFPVFGVFGGVHGLERVGTHVVVHWLESLLSRLTWDQHLRESFKHARIVSIPLINPGGMYLNRRSNPNGIDLMRNAPVEAVSKASFLVGGHRIGAALPWFRGKVGQDMQLESKTLCDFVLQETVHAKAIITLDCHSGFGTEDRLWYPYAKQVGEFPHEQSALAFGDLLRSAHPNHVYIVEPQAKQYTTNGDLWDFIYDTHLARATDVCPPYVPWTLEMGSWAWVRKNPKQALSLLGPFNPVLSHRYRRTMRRHLMLFEIMWAAVRNFSSWARGQ